MKIFDNMASAKKYFSKNKIYYINRICPRCNEEVFCGTWCALFQYFPKENKKDVNISPHVIIGCGNDKKVIYINEDIKD